MNTINSAITLASLVNEHPDLAGELERRGLDYCCGGQRTLLEACAAKGLDPASTTVELSQAASRTATAAEWASMEAAALVEHLVTTHNAYLWAELPAGPLPVNSCSSSEGISIGLNALTFAPPVLPAGRRPTRWPTGTSAMRTT